MSRETNGPSLPFSRRLQRLTVIAVASYWVAMFIGTHTPMPDLPEFPHSSDKYMHFIGYAGLAFLLGAWRAAQRDMSLRDYVLVFAITAAYGIVDELLQAIPMLHRTCDPLDWLADCVGSLCGLAALWGFVAVYRRFSPRRVDLGPRAGTEQ